MQIQVQELLRQAGEARQQAEQMHQQAAHKEQEAKRLQEQGDRLARLVVNQLEPTPLWFCHQEINQQEAAHCRALREEAAVAAEEAKAREQTQQRQTHHQHNKQVRFLVPTGQWKDMPPRYLMVKEKMPPNSCMSSDYGKSVTSKTRQWSTHSKG